MIELNEEQRRIFIEMGILEPIEWLIRFTNCIEEVVEDNENSKKIKLTPDFFHRMSGRGRFIRSSRDYIEFLDVLSQLFEEIEEEEETIK